MAVFFAPTMMDVVYSGACPLAVAHGSTKLEGVKAGDKVRLNQVSAGTKVYDVKLVHGALGSGVKIDLGFDYALGEAGGSADAFFKAVDCAAAGRKDAVVAPITLEFDAYITATVVAGDATGSLDSVLTFEFKGK